MTQITITYDDLNADAKRRFREAVIPYLLKTNELLLDEEALEPEEYKRQCHAAAEAAIREWAELGKNVFSL